MTAAPQQDAGTGRDAGHDRATAIPIAAGKTYAGRLDPVLVYGDTEDWYTFQARPGQTITLTATASLHPAVPADGTGVAGCWTVLDPSGNELSPHCSSTTVNEPPAEVEVLSAGTHTLVYLAQNGLPPHDYTFGLTLRGGRL